VSGGLVIAAVLLILIAAGGFAALRWTQRQSGAAANFGDRRVAQLDATDPPPVAPVVHEPDPAPAVAAARVDAAAPAAATAPSPPEPAAPPSATSPGVSDAAPAAVAPVADARAAAHSAPPPANEHVRQAPPAQEPPAATTLASVTAQPAGEPRTPSSDRQDLQPRRAAHSSKKIVVQRGDTLMNLAAREYGNANYTVLDVVRVANPGIQDVNRIIAGSEIVFPDPSAGTRVQSTADGLSVLVVTTPVLAQAQELQRMAGTRYRYPADLEPIAFGDGRNLYRVSLRQVPDKEEAQQIADSLGSILKDPS
jgi:phage tail protein X